MVVLLDFGVPANGQGEAVLVLWGQPAGEGDVGGTQAAVLPEGGSHTHLVSPLLTHTHWIYWYTPAHVGPAEGPSGSQETDCGVH